VSSKPGAIHREGNWHATWKVITLTNDDPNSPFRMTVIRFFSTSLSRWPTDECEKKSDQYAFGQDTTGSKGSRSVCSSFFVWNNPQELITLTLPKFYNFYWGKALSKLPSTFIQNLPKEMLALQLVSSQNNGLLIRQDVLLDSNKIGISADDFKRTFSSNSEESVKKSILNWRVNYGQAVAQSFLDSLEIQPDVYSLKLQTTPPLETNPEAKFANKKEVANPPQASVATSTVSNSEKQLAIEREKLEQEKLIFEEQKKLAEEKRKFEEERKQAEIDSIRRQKELLVLQEEREKLEKLQENKRRNDDELVLKAEKRKQIEDDKRQAAEARKVAEEEKRKLEAQKKAPPTIEVTQSEPDEYGAVILEISVSKPTKSLLINGDNEGANPDGKYIVKRILKKNGKTNLTIVASDDYGNKGTLNWTGELKSTAKKNESNALPSKNSLQCWSTHTSCNADDLINTTKNEATSIKSIMTLTFSNNGCRLDSYYYGNKTTISPDKIKCQELNGIFTMNISGCKQSFSVENKLDLKPPQKRLQHYEISGDCAESQIYAFNKLKERKSTEIYNLISTSDSNQASSSTNEKLKNDTKNSTKTKSLKAITDPIEYVTEKKWFSTENPSCNGSTYEIFSNRIPTGNVFVINDKIFQDFSIKHQHQFTKISAHKFELISKSFSEGNAGLLPLLNNDPSVVVAEQKITIELISPESFRRTEVAKNLNIDSLTKNGEVIFESSKINTSVSYLCMPEENASAKDAIDALIPKIEAGRKTRAEIASRSNIKLFFACGEKNAPASQATWLVKEIISLISEQTNPDYISTVINGYKCSYFNKPIPPAWTNRAQLIKQVGEKKYYVIESDASFSYGGVNQ
jgi:hypothetical protein